jgi:hypothetical protein
MEVPARAVQLTFQTSAGAVGGRAIEAWQARSTSVADPGQIMPVARVPMPNCVSRDATIRKAWRPDGSRERQPSQLSR